MTLTYCRLRNAGSYDHACMDPSRTGRPARLARRRGATLPPENQPRWHGKPMSPSRPPPQGTEREPGRGRWAVSLSLIFFLKISAPHARAYVCARVPAPAGN